MRPRRLIMPKNNDDIDQGDSPITPPEGDIEEQEIDMPEPVPVPELAPEPVAHSGWDWIGSPSRPEAQEESDGISDLFRVTDEDVGASDEDLSDLTDVDIERDIVDADDDGSLDDLVTVTEADIMGDDIGQRPSKSPSKQSRMRYKFSPRYQPPTSIGGIR
jgi:hypothetical protein